MYDYNEHDAKEQHTGSREKPPFRNTLFLLAQGSVNLDALPTDIEARYEVDNATTLLVCRCRLAAERSSSAARVYERPLERLVSRKFTK